MSDALRSSGGVMAAIEQSIEVEVPLSTAYNQCTQVEAFPQFMDSVREVRQIDDTHVHFVPEGILVRLGDAINAPERRVQGDLERFKELIESRDAESGAWRGEVKRPDEA